MTDDELVRGAIEAKESAYAPYSNFRVGAALLTKKGNVYSGCNVENRSYGLTVCGERVAIQNAVSAGEREFEALAVATDSEDFVPPCGACRQVIWEFSKDLRVILINRRGETQTTNIQDLLPIPFPVDPSPHQTRQPADS